MKADNTGLSKLMRHLMPQVPTLFLSLTGMPPRITKLLDILFHVGSCINDLEAC